ncbi:acylphosphatase-1 [Drosophila eugracilis]|uniref:acylphosphatase-1 n=1 Tax=Drosophila eugracilis TaxID=29029 RepID=UPI001BD912BE|nr:acylphosphatase-1 [Drosophila eugracilis]
MASQLVHSCEFEVFGKVQGVNFRRHALRKAKTLGVRGWCMNSGRGTVKGYIEGRAAEMDVMKEWLRTTGSPLSNIEKVEFSSQRERQRYGYTNFHIKPDRNEHAPGNELLASSTSHNDSN